MREGRGVRLHISERELTPFLEDCWTILFHVCLLLEIKLITYIDKLSETQRKAKRDQIKKC